jgi:hypothetical protein
MMAVIYAKGACPTRNINGVVPVLPTGKGIYLRRFRRYALVQAGEGSVDAADALGRFQQRWENTVKLLYPTPVQGTAPQPADCDATCMRHSALANGRAKQKLRRGSPGKAPPADNRVAAVHSTFRPPVDPL